MFPSPSKSIFLVKLANFIDESRPFGIAIWFYSIIFILIATCYPFARYYLQYEPLSSNFSTEEPPYVKSTNQDSFLEQITAFSMELPARLYGFSWSKSASLALGLTLLALVHSHFWKKSRNIGFLIYFLFLGSESLRYESSDRYVTTLRLRRVVMIIDIYRRIQGAALVLLKEIVKFRRLDAS